VHFGVFFEYVVRLAFFTASTPKQSHATYCIAGQLFVDEVRRNLFLTLCGASLTPDAPPNFGRTVSVEIPEE
jgi:hypothetical protein